MVAGRSLCADDKRMNIDHINSDRTVRTGSLVSGLNLCWCDGYLLVSFQKRYGAMPAFKDSDVACSTTCRTLVLMISNVCTTRCSALCRTWCAPVDTGRLTNALPNGPHRAQACLEAGPASARSVMTDLERTVCAAACLFESLLADAATPVTSRARQGAFDWTLSIGRCPEGLSCV
jgi:hypothetical protein